MKDLITRSLVFSFAITCLACGDQVTILECPLGTLPQGDQCIPIEEDTVVAADTTPVADTFVAQDTFPPPDTAPFDTAPPADTTLPPQPNGSPCVKNDDCLGGTCLSWAGGYCTQLGCLAESCAAASTCVVIEGNNDVCLADCTGCSGEGRDCKTLVDGQTGELHQACYAVDPNALPIGSPCTDPTQCTGAQTCLGGFPGGYCATLGCDASSCGPTGSCVRLGGRPTCLKRCTGDPDCGSMPGAERACRVLRDVTDATANVCVSGVEGAPLGAACGSDFECDSGSCQIVGEGRCSQSQSPCFPATQATDCGSAEFCFVTNESRVGVCSQPCGPGATCSGQSFCVVDGDGDNLGWCRPQCDGPGGSVACPAGSDLTCRFGVPLNAGGQGRYVCTIDRPGGFGSGCQNDVACRSNICTQTTGPGVCAALCGDDDACPFGGACVYGDDGSVTCQVTCFSSLDCPSGFACQTPSGSVRDVCVPL